MSALIKASCDAIPKSGGLDITQVMMSELKQIMSAEPQNFLKFSVHLRDIQKNNTLNVSFKLVGGAKDAEDAMDANGGFNDSRFAALFTLDLPLSSTTISTARSSRATMGEARALNLRVEESIESIAGATLISP